MAPRWGSRRTSPGTRITSVAPARWVFDITGTSASGDAGVGSDTIGAYGNITGTVAFTTQGPRSLVTRFKATTHGEAAQSESVSVNVAP